jgi:hypothetical protein
MVFRSSILLVCVAGLVTLISCSDSGSDSSSASDPTTVTSSEPQWELEATIEAYADTLRAEAGVLRIELETGDVNDEDVDVYWAALQKRIKYADQLHAMLVAEPTWLESICGWYEARLKDPHLEVIQLRNRISARDRYTGAAHSRAQLLKRGAGSAEGARAYTSTMVDHPAKATNIHIMCVNFGHIEEG